MNQRQVVKEVCRSLRDRWWDVDLSETLPGEMSISFGGHEGEPSILVFMWTSAEGLMRGLHGDRLSLTVTASDEDEPVVYESIGFLDTRKIKKSLHFAMQRQAVLKQTTSHLQEKLGRDPTEEEICRTTGWDPDTFH